MSGIASAPRSLYLGNDASPDARGRLGLHPGVTRHQRGESADVIENSFRSSSCLSGLHPRVTPLRHLISVRQGSVVSSRPKVSRVLIVALGGTAVLSILLGAPIVLHTPVAVELTTSAEEAAIALQEPLPPPPAPRCEDGEISEDRAREMIESCVVEVMFQPHEGPVAMQMRNGRSYCANQSALDSLPRLAISSCPNSPPVVVME